MTIIRDDFELLEKLKDCFYPLQGFVFMSTTANSLIYIYKDAKLREYVKKQICCCWKM